MKNKNGDAIHNILNYPDDERQKWQMQWFEWFERSQIEIPKLTHF